MISKSSFSNVLAVIPARWQSIRFPGKPLALLGGRPVIEHVWEHVKAVFGRCLVATDDERIAGAVSAFGGRAIMTDKDLRSGTDRCCQAYAKCGERAEIIVNVQGDEPFVEGKQLELLVRQFDADGVDIATLCCPFGPDEDIRDEGMVKVVVSKTGRALYFSRSVIPYQRDVAPAEWAERHTYYRHLGLYAFREDALQRIARMGQSSLEKMEKLEQLRWLENDVSIRVGVVDHAFGVGIDTPDDLARAEMMIEKEGRI